MFHEHFTPSTGGTVSRSSSVPLAISDGSYDDASSFPYLSMGLFGTATAAATLSWMVARKMHYRKEACERAECLTLLECSSAATMPKYVRISGIVGADDPHVCHDDDGRVVQAAVSATQMVREYEEQYAVKKAGKKKQRSVKEGSDRRGKETVEKSQGEKRYRWRTGSQVVSYKEKSSRSIYVEEIYGNEGSICRVQLQLEGAETPGGGSWRSDLTKIKDEFKPAVNAGASTSTQGGSRRDLGYRSIVRCLKVGERVVVQGELVRTSVGSVTIRRPRAFEMRANAFVADQLVSISSDDLPFVFHVGTSDEKVRSAASNGADTSLKTAVGVSAVALIAGIVAAAYVSSWARAAPLPVAKVAHQ